MDTLNEKTHNRTIILADLGLLLVALFWGGGFVAGKFALTGVTPLNSMAYRYLGATLVMVFFCFRKFKLMNKKTLLCGGGIGLLIFSGCLLQTIGLQYTTPGKQSFIISLYTVMVPLLSWIIVKTKPSKRILVAAVIALLGISLLTLTDDLTIGFGDFLTFIFAITFSLQVVFIGIFMKDMDAGLFTFVQLAVTAILSLIALLIFDTPANLLTLSAPCLMGLIYLMTFNTAFAFLLQNTCQKYAPTNHTAIILSSEAVFGTIFAITLAAEIFTGRMVIGCILMFIAIGAAELPTKKKPEN